jgi:hypothetical protein
MPGMRTAWLLLVVVACGGGGGGSLDDVIDKALAAVERGDADAIEKLMPSVADQLVMCPGKAKAPGYETSLEERRTSMRRHIEDDLAVCKGFDWANAKRGKVDTERGTETEPGCGQFTLVERTVEYTAGDQRWRVEVEAYEVNGKRGIDPPSCEPL